MKKIFLYCLLSISFLAPQAFAGSFTISDDWKDWPGYTSNMPGKDENGTPKVKNMVINWNDAGVLTGVQLVLDANKTKWQEYNSLFINSYGDTANGTGQYDWDYLVHDGGNKNDGFTVNNNGDPVPGDGVWSVKKDYNYTFTNTAGSIRHNSPNGIRTGDLDSNYGENDDEGWVKNQNVMTYDFTTIDGLKINVFDGLFIAFSPFCANDVIGGEMAPVPEPATMLLFGIGLLGFAGVARRKF